MMLHERTLKNLLIKKISTYLENYTQKVKSEELHFDEPIDNYVGIKSHHGYPFLFNKEKSLTYPRGIHGKIIVQVLENLQKRNVYTSKTFENKTYKVRPKKFEKTKET